MGKDYYKILGVDKGASQEEIKKTYRAKAHQHHPDKKGGDEKKFKEINEAYQVLGNSQKRAQYDQFGSAFENAQAGGGFHGFDGFRDFSNYANGFEMDDLGDIFGGIGDIFGFGGGTQKQQRRKGGDIQAILTIDFNEAVFGAEKEFSINKNIKCDKCRGNGAEPGTKIETCRTCGGSGTTTRVQRTVLGNMRVNTTCHDCAGEGKAFSQKCSKCSGSGIVRETVKLKLKIPAGIDDGETIRLSGQGEAGTRGAPEGDLYIKTRVIPSKNFERDEYDIRSQVEISFTQAVLGDKIKIETVEGPVSLKIPEGTQSGTIFKLAGKGIYKLKGGSSFGGNKKGDHYIKVKVIIPKNLNRSQKNIIRDLNI